MPEKIRTYIRSQNDSSVEFHSRIVLLVDLLLAFRADLAFRLLVRVQ